MTTEWDEVSQASGEVVADNVGVFIFSLAVE